MLLGFKTRFIGPIMGGSKCQTVRAKRKIQPKIGEKLYMYTGLRTAACRPIPGEFTLLSIHKVQMKIVRLSNVVEIYIKVDGKQVTGRKLNNFFINDGFTDKHDFADYWLKDVKPNRKWVYRLRGTFQLFTWNKVKY